MTLRATQVRGLLAVASLIGLLLLPARVRAQGRWEFGVGAFGDADDTVSTSGVTGEFLRWRGEERRFHRGLRIAYFKRRIDNVTIPQPPTSQFNVSEKRGAWGLEVGAPVRYAPVAGVVRPFVEADPSLMLYNSIFSTRFTRISTGKVGLDDQSALHIGPSLGLAAGVQLPGGFHGPRFRLRASYRVALLAGGEGTGMSGSLWKAWDVSAGGSIGY